MRSLAFDFSPEIEQTAADTVVFFIAPLREMLGSWNQIASEIARRGHNRNLRAHLGIAANVDTSLLLSFECRGILIAMPGEEASKLGAIRLDQLFTYSRYADAGMLETFKQWGLEYCHHLAALPEDTLKERLGEVGVYLRQLAVGTHQRALRLRVPKTCYEEAVELEYSIEKSESLLFLFGRVLSDLCLGLRSQSEAARSLELQLTLDSKRKYCCRLEFPVALHESKNLLKLLQLHLERHPPGASVVGFRLRLEPTAPRRLQNGLFVPPSPEPDRL